MNIDHIDVVTTHRCNMHCKYCIDTFLNKDGCDVDVGRVEDFLSRIRKSYGDGLTVLLLGGEPTMLGEAGMRSLAKAIHALGFESCVSTNGKNKEVIKAMLPYYDWMQITMHSAKDIEYWKPYCKTINAKLSGDQYLTLSKLDAFKDAAKEFGRRSVSMYFTPDFKELCTDREVWEYLNGLDWVRSSSYMYAMDDGVRFKRCIPGETNIIDEPRIPKFYPNGNYNKTWCNEDMDDYLEIYDRDEAYA